ncbi:MULTISPECIES: TlpA disulfide reductase family protein [Neisseria]|uniref:Thioredoxin family protein n=1 Tax=Neisseria musculi TaxID=1815583 RepID=A0A7H1MC00_9NEIS|nr:MULTISPECIES: TlpA disulfide reductase family protein [Neisseria]MBF0804841.1 TlpA family protein disulfide reductase [Neisseria sp. 19428wB4_WF04]QNT59165.1 ahpC/TSA family protein [Neisseria musculi]TFU39454.1 TlpA family protein disulfide reductase [Neisseria sp. WF04]
MKILTALLLAAVCGQAAASELQSWDSSAPQHTASLKAPVRIINLWATWCAPCRKEMPAMSAWYRKQKKGSVDMVGIALDSRENIAQFLKQTPVSYPVWRYTGSDSRSLMKSFGNTVGGLPFTVVEAKKCDYKQTVFGEVTAEKLNQALAKVRAKCG